MINYFYLPCYSNFLSLITKLFLLRYFSKLFFFFRWRWQLPLNSLSQLPLYIVVIISSFSLPGYAGKKRKREREKIAEAEDNNKKLSALKKFDFADQWKKKSFNLIKKKKKTTARPNQPNSTQPNSTKPTKPTVIPQLCNFCLFHCHFILGLY